ncbi:A/G-specific adenine glycosylase [Nocardioides convexus]|uniref:A/G-specific adenine glycosylase n=1 Tax=Nocardioides convexus TaxID=2712224 RepID=UPI0024186C0A|nr:A/G-specific adenine glycosylase [Nocardioides convexus]
MTTSDATTDAGTGDGLVEPILRWYDAHARDLPWRRPEASAWSVLVSEFMLQQTPVVRVLPVHATWLERWPTPAALAAEPSGEAVRAWGRLGYPRRALRLHAAAVAITEQHGGTVPASYDEFAGAAGGGRLHRGGRGGIRLRPAAGGARHQRPPGARARRHRRGVPRPVGQPRRAGPGRGPATRGPTDRGDVVGRGDGAGALVCTADRPRCTDCPVLEACAWQAAGAPAYDGPPRPVQTYAGTDRQCRGRLLAVLRDAPGAVGQERMDAAWDQVAQRERALASLIADGLVVRRADGRYALP